VTEPQKPPTVTYPAPVGSRLAELAAAYAVAKPHADAAEERLKAITDAIKVELTAAIPGGEDIRLTAPELPKPLRLRAETSWRLNVAGLKKADPLTYVRWARQSTRWVLKAE
jgi:hypothetical protein